MVRSFCVLVTGMSKHWVVSIVGGAIVGVGMVLLWIYAPTYVLPRWIGFYVLAGALLPAIFLAFHDQRMRADTAVAALNDKRGDRRRRLKVLFLEGENLYHHPPYPEDESAWSDQVDNLYRDIGNLLGEEFTAEEAAGFHQLAATQEESKTYYDRCVLLKKRLDYINVLLNRI